MLSWVGGGRYQQVAALWAWRWWWWSCCSRPLITPPTHPHSVIQGEPIDYLTPSASVIHTHARARTHNGHGMTKYTLVCSIHSTCTSYFITHAPVLHWHLWGCGLMSEVGGQPPGDAPAEVGGVWWQDLHRWRIYLFIYFYLLLLCF